jgi:NADH-quinone oxidoreductase subunit E
MITVLDNEILDTILEKHKKQPGEALSILEQAQEAHPRKFLPAETLDYIAQGLGMPAARLYSIVTFYSFFNLKPQGEHTIAVCRGTACHTRGSQGLLEDIGVAASHQGGSVHDESSYTTADGRLTVKVVACFGQCALAPIIAVDGVMHGNVDTRMAEKLVNGILREKKQ